MILEDLQAAVLVLSGFFAIVSFAMSVYGLNLQRTEVSKQNKRMIELLESILKAM